MITTLESKRLLLRRFVDEDLNDLFTLYRDPDMRRFYPEGTLSLDETREELEWFKNGHPEHPELGLWATILKQENRFIGRCGLLPWQIDGQHEVEVAYMIDKQYWGQGLGTEAALVVAAYGFNILQLKRLVCLIDDENIASQRVAEKIGMRFERRGRDEKGPYLLYAQNRVNHVV
ncbi:MAG TPA: GNAT family N-acetyltransferase [Roseiflexaceae bacterium]|nr:GNAT family N-acetyltransferase [Roseiflexaceae bacterium]